jgi:hypothetical protein
MNGSPPFRVVTAGKQPTTMRISRGGRTPLILLQGGWEVRVRRTGMWVKSFLFVAGVILCSMIGVWLGSKITLRFGFGL